MKRVPMNQIQNRADFLTALENGMTFLEACEYSDNDPATLTEIIKTNPGFNGTCRDAVRKSVQLYLDLAEEYAKKGLNTKSLEARRAAKDGGGKLNLWGSIGNLKDMHSDQVLRAIRENNSRKEVACSLGVTYAELDAYLAANDLHDVIERISHKRSW